MGFAPLAIRNAGETTAHGASDGKCECEGISGDLDPANDVAHLVLNETGGTGGGLPVTGTSTGLIVASGGVLLAAGAVGFVLTRRRRLRFVA